MKSSEPTANASGLPGVVGRSVCALAFLLLTLASMVFYMRLVAPEPPPEVMKPFVGYSVDPMQEALAPDLVRAEMEHIVSFGSRFMGQPGWKKAENYIRDEFKKAGLEVLEQHNITAAPKTIIREISTPEGELLPDVEIYPFMPNHLQPQVTPEEGVVGRVILMTSATLLSEVDFSDGIGLIHCDPDMVIEEYGYNFIKYAQLGLKALLVSHPDGFDAIEWHKLVQRHIGMVTSVPINYPRLAATEGVFNYIGKRVRIRVRTEYVPVTNSTLIGVLRAEKPAAEALIITSPYDAAAILPDLAVTPLQALHSANLLCMARGMAQYRSSLKRDVIFVASGSQMMGNSGVNSILRVLGSNPAGSTENRLLVALGIGDDDEAAEGSQGKVDLRLGPIQRELEEHEARLEEVIAVLKAFEDDAFMVDPSKTDEAIHGTPAETVTFFEEQYEYVLNTLIFEASEPKLMAKIDVERIYGADPDSAEMKEYLVHKNEYDHVLAGAGYSPTNLLESKADFAEEYQVRRRLLERFEELREHHEFRRLQLGEDIAVVNLLVPYAERVIMEPRPVPSYKGGDKEQLSFGIGDWRLTPPKASVYQSVLSSAIDRLGVSSQVTLPPLGKRQDAFIGPHMGVGLPRWSMRLWGWFEYPIAMVVNLKRVDSYLRISAPVELPFMRDIDSIQHTLSVLGETAASLAHGNGAFPPARRFRPFSFGGQVFVSNVGKSIVPNYPLKHALLSNRGLPAGGNFEWPGYFVHPIIRADVYGRYNLPNEASDFIVWNNYWAGGRNYSPIAVGYGDDGVIAYMKDEGEEGQRLYKSVGLNVVNRQQLKRVNIVTFRAAPVSVFDLTNPQTLKNYTGVELVSKSGLTTFNKQCAFTINGAICNYIEPDERYYMKLKSGAPDNENAQVTRGFMLGADECYELDSEKEIDGPGYLAIDTPIASNIAFEVAHSMVEVNQKRLDLQRHYGMADERTIHFHDQSTSHAIVSETGDLSHREATLEARDAVTYATLDHPVLRESIFEAVIGILWYLALLVPFVFFFEKLVFGFTDIRKQITAQSITFIVVFGLLKLLHPAFEMIRSSLMILLGFVIILISGGITMLFIGKFRENFEDLRKQQGRVRAAEVNTLGVIGVAFMLGLNNMHRRAVRTGLTCATLVLMTFVMICFTSVDTDVVDSTVAIGKAPYQGILYKEDKFRPVTSGPALTEKYGERFDICLRKMTLGREWRSTLLNPDLQATHEDGERVNVVPFDSILQFNAEEPLQSEIKFLTNRGWFTEAQDLDSEDPYAVMIPDQMALKLGVSPEDVNTTDIIVEINGRDCMIQGIFDSVAFDSLRGIDGTDLLPFDVESMTIIQRQLWQVLAEVDSPRIAARNLVMFTNRQLSIEVENCEMSRPVSLVINMPDLPYKEAKTEIESFLEQSGRTAYYGLDGIAYQGERTRKRTMAGLIEMLIPLIIAALTVLNTMKGSVYERREEIFVYNAVGIAPKFVFFMFFAEAFVYAVVGSVLGYILSQGTGRALFMLDMTGGLKMAFTSIMTIYVSLTIALSVFISTYFPAKSAMEISAPAEESGWKLPDPEGDTLAFDLPFTFNYGDRIAILTFFERYLHDHGEGSAGRFFAGEPTCGVADERDALADNALVPMVTATIWLKPFDLGVSQKMTIVLPTDKETQEFKARIILERLSGTKESWMRLNFGFVQLVRRHFLHWRAVTPEERQEMFVEARGELEQKLLESA